MFAKGKAGLFSWKIGTQEENYIKCWSWRQGTGSAGPHHIRGLWKMKYSAPLNIFKQKITWFDF